MTSRRSTSLRTACLGLLLALPLSAARADSEYSVQGTHTSERPTIDGKLDEAAWATAPLQTNWFQTRDMHKPAREQTEFKVLYDRDNLYFGFHLKDAHPDKVKAFTVQNEAFIHQEDNVTIILDTFLDHRNAYYFWTNLLGVRTDGRIIADGESFSTDWKGEWESKGSIVADGWTLEVRIPFSNFQYNDAEEHTFGMLLDREQVGLQEWSNWTPDGVNSAKVSRYPHLTGLKGIAPRSVINVTPYISAQVGLPATPLAGTPGQTEQGIGPSSATAPFPLNAGVDIRIDPVRWATVKLTVNPDFAQFDVDEDILYLDVEERLIAERRDFFLQGQDLFAMPIKLFFSRRIAPNPKDHMLGGALVVGKYGGFGFNALDTQTLQIRPDGTFENVNAGVLRLVQDIGKRSQVGIVGLNRFGDEKYGVAGIDANISLIEEWFIQAQATKSWSPDPSPGAEAYHLGIHRFTTLDEYWLDFDDLGKNFRDPIGYIPVIDKVGFNWHASRNIFINSKILPRVDFIYDALWRMDHDGHRTRHRHNLTVSPYVGDHVGFSLNYLYDDQLGFRDNVGTFTFVLNPNEWQGFQVSALGGTFLGGSLLGANAQVNWKLGPRVVLRLNGFYTRSEGVPEGSPLFGTAGDGYTWSAYAQLRYHFSPDLYGRITFQRGDCVGLADTNKVKGQVIDAVIGWHYREGSDAYLVYTEQPYQGQQERRLLSKLSYMF